jgi:hypothetical protein
MAVIAEQLPSSRLFQQWHVTRGAAPGGLDISGPSPFDTDAPALTVPPLDPDHSPHTWLFPAGAEEIEELRYSPGEEGVVVERLRQPFGPQYERVRTIPRHWWAGFESSSWGSEPPITEPILRYRLDGQTVYRGDDDTRVCVREDLYPLCDLLVPSEEALVSLRTVWETHDDLEWQREDGRTVINSPDSEIDADLGGVVPEPVSSAPGHLARFDWHRRTSAEDDLEPLTTFALYFDDGAPAVLSALQPPDRSTESPDLRGRGDTGTALFPGLVDDAVVPLSTHPFGHAPLLAPELDVAESRNGYTVYEPLAAEDLEPIAYVNLGENGDPVETGWLASASVRP